MNFYCLTTSLPGSQWLHWSHSSLVCIYFQRFHSKQACSNAGLGFRLDRCSFRVLVAGCSWNVFFQNPSCIHVYSHYAIVHIDCTVKRSSGSNLLTVCQKLWHPESSFLYTSLSPLGKIHGHEFNALTIRETFWLKFSCNLPRTDKLINLFTFSKEKTNFRDIPSL